MKNYFEVNGVTKNLQGDILYVGYYSSYTDKTKRTNYAISDTQAIRLIDEKLAEFWVVEGDNKQRIGVVHPALGRPYLRSHKNGTRSDNLDNLPILPQIL